MKKYKPYYSESSVIYWPTYNSGIGLIVYFSIIFSVSFSILIWSYLDSVTQQDRILCVVFSAIIIIIALLIIKFILKAMFVKITVTHIGFEYCNVKTNKLIQISWTNVSEVYFCQDHWRGRKICKIHTNSFISGDYKKNQTVVLPIQGINENVLLQFIPQQLWKNNPKNVFYTD